MHNFDSNNHKDGYSPIAGLIIDATGNCFGTTYSGGTYGYGTVFEIKPTPDRQPSVGESVSLFREPDAGNLLVRFDEREQETEPSQTGLR